MNRFFWGNFDFEEQLRGESQRSARVERLLLELAPCWLAVADADDRIWCPAKLPAEFLTSLDRWGLPPDLFVSDIKQIPPGMELVPWGWSPAAVEFGERHRLVVNSPPLDVVQLANSREYSVENEQAADDNAKFATLCRTFEEVFGYMQHIPDETRWVIKANWSHAARERVLGRGMGITGPDYGWIIQRLKRDGVVSWERWLQREAEIGIQWHITPGQSPQLIAITELLVDARGQYIGTRSMAAPRGIGFQPVESSKNKDDRLEAYPTQDHAEWAQLAAEATRPIVSDLARRGYFGPVGIDAMRYFDPDSNTSRTRPLQDINARWTMGRLAAGWFARLDASGPVTWRHGRWETQAGDEPVRLSIATSPERINGSPVVHRTWLQLPERD